MNERVPSALASRVLDAADGCCPRKAEGAFFPVGSGLALLPSVKEGR